MAERSNQEWLDALQGASQGAAVAALRAVLLRGLRYGTASYDRCGDCREEFELLLAALQVNGYQSE